LDAEARAAEGPNSHHARTYLTASLHHIPQNTTNYEGLVPASVILIRWPGPDRSGRAALTLGSGDDETRLLLSD
jgi:hypothetical protein